MADTRRWEEQAAYYIDTNDKVAAFVKNDGLGFAIPYLHNGQRHDYVPDFLIRLKTDPPSHLILETKGFDPLEEVKRAAAERWVAAVNADGTYGRWAYAIAKKTTEVNGIVEALIEANATPMTGTLVDQTQGYSHPPCSGFLSAVASNCPVAHLLSGMHWRSIHLPAAESGSNRVFGLASVPLSEQVSMCRSQQSITMRCRHLGQT